MSLDLDTTLGTLVMWVPGRPQTAGSKRAFVNPKTGKAIVTESGDQGAKKTWRGDLRDAALDARRLHWGINDVAQVPLAIEAVFVRPRPSSHLGSGRNAGRLTAAGMFARPKSRPDATKLLRAAEDALTGVLWMDDAQIVQQLVWKAFGDDVGLDPRAEGLLLHVWESREYRGPRVLSA